MVKERETDQIEKALAKEGYRSHRNAHDPFGFGRRHFGRLGRAFAKLGNPDE